VKIDTDQWTTLAAACRDAGVSQSTGYRTAKRLRIVHEFFGVKIVRRADVHRLLDERLPIGNADWIRSSEAAGEAARKAVDSRMRRVRQQGYTNAEIARNQFLAEGKARQPRGET